MTNIEAYAFDYTAWFNNLPNGIVYLGKVLYACKGSFPVSTTITVPNHIVSITKNAFKDCLNLVSVNMLEGLLRIGDNAFIGCTNLTNVTIPGSVNYIGLRAFQNCINLTSVNIPCSIGDYAFLSCNNLTNVTFSKGVSIGKGAFSYCRSVENIILPDGMTSIGEGAFSNCFNLKGIYLPISITDIGSNVFNQCNNMLTIFAKAISKPDGWLNDWNPNNYYVLWGYLETRENGEFRYAVLADDSIHILSLSSTNTNHDIIIPLTIDGLDVTSFSYTVFYDNLLLTSVVISDNIKQIPKFAFSGCDNLNAVTFGPNSQLSSIGPQAFASCRALKSIIIPDSVTNIGWGVFYYCPYLENVILPNQLTSLENELFTGCNRLKDITIPGSITSIGDRVFKYCETMASIVIPISVTTIGNEAFMGCNLLNINCRAYTQPSGWSSSWNPNNRPVHWGYIY